MFLLHGYLEMSGEHSCRASQADLNSFESCCIKLHVFIDLALGVTIAFLMCDGRVVVESIRNCLRYAHPAEAQRRDTQCNALVV